MFVELGTMLTQRSESLSNKAQPWDKQIGYVRKVSYESVEKRDDWGMGCSWAGLESITVYELR